MDTNDKENQTPASQCITQDIFNQPVTTTSETRDNGSNTNSSKAVIMRTETFTKNEQKKK